MIDPNDPFESFTVPKPDPALRSRTLASARVAVTHQDSQPSPLIRWIDRLAESRTVQWGCATAILCLVVAHLVISPPDTSRRDPGAAGDLRRLSSELELDGSRFAEGFSNYGYLPRSRQMLADVKLSQLEAAL